jgi:hypothetical protein
MPTAPWIDASPGRAVIAPERNAGARSDEITGTLMVLAAIPRNSEDSAYERILPSAFLYADGRIYRELNFLATDITQEVTLISNERDFVLPSDILTVHYINVCTPAGPITSSTKRRELKISSCCSESPR